MLHSKRKKGYKKSWGLYTKVYPKKLINVLINRTRRYNADATALRSCLDLYLRVGQYCKLRGEGIGTS